MEIRVDRIDSLLGELLDAQGSAVYWESSDGDEVDRYRACVNALCRQIADEWRAKDAALEAALELCMLNEQPQLWMVEKLEGQVQAALAPAKGES